MPEVVIIAAVAKNRVIGRDNQLIWNIPEDMAHFKALTSGQTVIMGRKTWESLPPRFRPLPGRRNIVISRQIDYAAPGAELSNSLENATICSYLKFAREFNATFPGFETDVHGLVKGADGTYYVDCVR